MKHFIFLTLVFYSFSLWAHPHYVRLGYTTCTGCHMSSDGSGLLTDYGKGISASESMFARDLDSENMTPSNYHQAFQMRVMNVASPVRNRTFPMQFDYLSSFNFFEQLKLMSILAVSPPENNQSVKSDFFNRLYFRELSLELTINNKANFEDRFKMGVGLLPLGIGLVDHTAYVRATNRLFVTDIPLHFSYYQNRAHYNFDGFVFLPHPKELELNAERGIGGRFFYKFNPKFSLGPQFLLGNSKSINRQMTGVLIKAGKDKFSYLGELDYTRRTIKADQSKFTQWAIYQGLSYFPWAYLSPSITYQKLIMNDTFKTEEERYAFLIDWKIFTTFSFSTEMRYKKNDTHKETEYLSQAYLNWW